MALPFIPGASVPLKDLTYTELLGRQDNLEHLCEFGSDVPLLASVKANLARVNEEIAEREAKGLTHISYAPGVMPSSMEDDEDYAMGFETLEEGLPRA